MSDKIELQSEASATHGLSSTEGAMLQRLVMRFLRDDVLLSKISAWIFTFTAIIIVVTAIANHNWTAAWFASVSAWLSWSLVLIRRTKASVEQSYDQPSEVR